MIHASLDIRISDTPVKFDGWVGRYTDANPVGEPAVIPSEMQDGFDFTYDMQMLSWDLMHFGNSIISKDKWRIVYKDDIAFTNENGFDKSGDPRADYINLRDLDKPLPKLMKRIVCAGSFIRGEQIGNKLWVYPGIGAIDANKPMPSIQTIINNNWFFYATIYRVTRGEHFPQGWDGADYFGPVLIPFIIDKPVIYDISRFIRWQSNDLPDPLRIYT